MFKISKFSNIDEILKDIENRYKTNEKTRKKLAKFNEPIELTFLDTNHKVTILINGDQDIEIKDNAANEEAPVKIEFISEQVLIDIFNKNLGAVKAYSSGKIKIIEGKIRNLLKLKSLLF